ncbi:J domain-containing protein [Mesobacillus subterraneus]|uniref:J domain-containing protein n=1 Tax=Mesobacillus subterraneus TaxID=285983 RepID=UPI001CFEF8EC|nr:J domain-containing protein [Mesobacillus subterraneus]WLR57221.1 J domain-containing protein [Mesobacillus subterraneus]
MLTIKEAAEQLISYGIDATDQDVKMWIEEGILKAEQAHRRNFLYKIHLKDLTEFIIQKYNNKYSEQLESTKQENTLLNDQLELLNTRLHIEQSKVRTLKKMLNAQIEASGTDPSQMEELLGLNKNTDSYVLKKEFKKILKALHPDRGGDERLFKVFNEHYENLK